MKVLGIQRGKKQNGFHYTILHVNRPFDEYESQNGQGFACENIYVGRELLHIDVGDNIDIVYGKGFGGKAVIKDILVHESDEIDEVDEDDII